MNVFTVPDVLCTSISEISNFGFNKDANKRCQTIFFSIPVPLHKAVPIMVVDKFAKILFSCKLPSCFGGFFSFFVFQPPLHQTRFTSFFSGAYHFLATTTAPEIWTHITKHSTQG